MSDKREVVVTPVHRDEPDLHKLAEALTRLVLEESGGIRVVRRTLEPAQHAPDSTAAHERHRRLRHHQLY